MSPDILPLYHLLPDARSTATLEDIRDIYSDGKQDTTLDLLTQTTSNAVIESIPDFISHGPWLPSVGEHLAAIYQKGLCIIEVVENGIWTAGNHL